MPRQFYTEKEIADLFKRGVTSLEVNDNVALTELAYEKAVSLGMKLMRDKPDNPPGAPVRPYLSQAQDGQRPAPIAPASACVVSGEHGSRSAAVEEGNLHHRIRDVVVARLGTQVDANLLDVIIKRVLASTGVK